MTQRMQWPLWQNRQDTDIMIGPGRTVPVKPGQWYSAPQIVGGTGELLFEQAAGPFDTKPDLDKALLMSGVGAQDILDIEDNRG